MDGRSAILDLPRPPSAPGPPLFGVYLNSPRYPTSRPEEICQALVEDGESPSIVVVGGIDDFARGTPVTGEISLLEAYGALTTVEGSDSTMVAMLEVHPTKLESAFVMALLTFGGCLVFPDAAAKPMGKYFPGLSAMYSLWYDGEWRELTKDAKAGFLGQLEDFAAALGCTAQGLEGIEREEIERAAICSLLGSVRWALRKDGSDGEFAFLISEDRKFLEYVRDQVETPRR